MPVGGIAGSLRRRRLPPPPPTTANLLRSLVQAVVRSLPGEPNLNITLTVGGKQRNMDRCGVVW